ncbi:MAG: exodeoxyribonuclease VII large subunit [Prevotellaceae bacterium]|jgi:exodeoxyribonuclease VII large subunit|nr:exodeoxyribonuclease VII large subunit [Prevotellaceae bacterium]
MNSVSLLELNLAIKSTLKSAFSEGVWVRAEISEIHENANGHCFIELVDKEEVSEKIVARQRATIWANNYRMIKPYFFAETNMEFAAGMQILVFCTVEMHENYGLSLTISDIDAAYTLGKMAMLRDKIIQKLTNEGILEMNKNLHFPILPQRIAVISSKTAAGFEDFCHQLKNNTFGYKFYVKLFEAAMQGEQTENAVISALDRIFEHADKFDVAVIIRGGGATSDLSAFNNYNIAAHVAQFPLPVICGIGHQRDLTVLDIVSNISAKTPTAAAETLIAKIQEQEVFIENASQSISYLVWQMLDNEQNNLKNISYKISYKTKEFLQNSRQKNENSLLLIKNFTKNFINSETQKIILSEKTINLLSPQTILKRGYTITKKAGKTAISSKEVKKNDKISVLFYDGEIEAEVV